jgi:hypothetical protein
MVFDAVRSGEYGPGVDASAPAGACLLSLLDDRRNNAGPKAKKNSREFDPAHVFDSNLG